MTHQHFVIKMSLGLVLLTYSSGTFAGRLGSPLQLMLTIRDRGDQRFQWDWLLPGIADDEVGLTVRLHGELDSEVEQRMRDTGLRFHRDESGQPRHIGPIYSVIAPWDTVRPLAAISAVARIELARPPGLVPHLDVSAPEIEAPIVWNRRDSQGRPIDGTGLVAADFDSGIDVFHPLFFHADGGVYEWLDVDGDGRFRAGTDAVDLDGDEEADENETLGLLEGVLVQRGYAWADGQYDADVDWLFNDYDGDGERDYGPEAGYTEQDPSFGELLFIIADTDGNGRLDVGESLLGLGTSKLIATLVSPDTIRYRGVDLIETPVVDPDWVAAYGEDDRADHGTGVSSVLAGGWADSGRRITGIAPGAELILVDFNNELGLAATLPWVISLGALVSSHPYGYKIFSFLDGSSNDELAIDLAYDNHSALQAIAVGNEANDQDDASALVSPDTRTEIPFIVHHYSWQSEPITLVALTIRWRQPEVQLVFSLRNPEDERALLGSATSSVMLGGTRADCTRETSTRGTAKFDILFYDFDGLSSGNWTLEVLNINDVEVEIWVSLYDNLFRGSMGTSFTDEDQVDPLITVSANATADRGIGACSYGTRHSQREETIGELSAFSSRGPRIDGFRVVDICAPGDYDVIWAQSSRGDLPLGGYSFGGGTSASTPHVAGALVLLRQAAPWARASEIEDALYGAAYVDEFVGDDAPNHLWGFGKVRIAAALEMLPPKPDAQPSDNDQEDLTPWDRGLTPDAGLPTLPSSPRIVGVEGGGCHCQKASGFRGKSRRIANSILRVLWP